MDAKKLLYHLLFPHTVIMCLLVPISAMFLVYSLASLSSSSPAAIVSYLLSFYTLTVWCMRLPALIRRIKRFKDENRYIRIWQNDALLRVNISLAASLTINIVYACFQASLGFYHSSLWYFSMSAYYLMLAIMRYLLLRRTSQQGIGKRAELCGTVACGAIFFIMNIVLSIIIFYIAYRDRVTKHHEITVIAIAAYTFFMLTNSIIGVARAKRYNSPAYSAAKTISLAAACVSMLTLEASMLSVFKSEDMSAEKQRLMIIMTGAVVCAVIVVLALNMILCGLRELKQTKGE